MLIKPIHSDIDSCAQILEIRRRGEWVAITKCDTRNKSSWWIKTDGFHRARGCNAIVGIAIRKSVGSKHCNHANIRSTKKDDGRQ